MPKKFLSTASIFFILIVLSLYVTLRVIARERRIASMNRVLEEIDSLSSNQEQPSVATGVVSPSADNRIANLQAFFRKYNSPLFGHAKYIVTASDKYNLDYRLLPAIAMQESTLCKFIPSDSHNCWGWGIYGNVVTRFTSYEEAIDTVARGLKKNYIDLGKTTPAEIMASYTPSSDGSWAQGVNSILRILE